MKTLLTDMTMSAEEASESMGVQAADPPKYPWGLSIHLDDDAMEKLNMADMKPGDTVMITAKAICTSCSSNQMQGGDVESSCDLQITDMQVSAQNAIYPNSGMQ